MLTNGANGIRSMPPFQSQIYDQCVQQLDRRGPPLPVGPAEASEASVGPSSQKRPFVWTGPGLPKRAILKPQAPTWRLDYYVIIEFLNELSLVRTDVSQSGLAAMNRIFEAEKRDSRYFWQNQNKTISRSKCRQIEEDADWYIAGAYAQRVCIRSGLMS